MSEPFTLSIYQIVGTGICVATEDGDKIYSKIHQLLKAGKTINLSFKNVETLTTAFLNAAIGQLYGGEFDYAFLEQAITFSDIEPEDRQLVDLVIENAKLYFANPQSFKEAADEALD